MSTPIPSLARRPVDYAQQNWPDFEDTINRDATAMRYMMQNKKRIEAIAAISDQILWTTSQMKPQYLPKTKTLEGNQFLLSNLLPLQTVCFQPLMAIREHIATACPALLTQKFSKTNWYMPREVRDAESPIDEVPLREEPPPLPSPSPEEPWTFSLEEKKERKEMRERYRLWQEKKYEEEERKLKEDAEKRRNADDEFWTDEAKGLSMRAERHKEIMANPGKHVDYFGTQEEEEGFTWADAIRAALRTYDAAYMEVDRLHRLIGHTRTNSEWPSDKIYILANKKGIPTRSSQEILLEFALLDTFRGPPTATSRNNIATWKTGMQVRNILDIHLGRFILEENHAKSVTRHWTNPFTRKINHPNGAEPAMFFICTHEYQKHAKWIVGSTTPLTGSTKVTKWNWADDVFKAVREQGLGNEWVARVKAANDAQRELESQLIGDIPVLEVPEDRLLDIRKEVIKTLRNDTAHQAHVARINCQGLSITRLMEPTQCCYRCQCNYQYNVLSEHLTEDHPDTIKHLKTYNWERQCNWDHQCAEGSAARQCLTFNENQDESNRPSSGRPKPKMLGTLKISKKKSTRFH